MVRQEQNKHLRDIQLRYISVKKNGDLTWEPIDPREAIEDILGV